jgi:membrane protein DedA with SNARE-associated domain
MRIAGIALVALAIVARFGGWRPGTWVGPVLLSLFVAYVIGMGVAVFGGTWLGRRSIRAAKRELQAARRSPPSLRSRWRVAQSRTLIWLIRKHRRG